MPLIRKLRHARECVCILTLRQGETPETEREGGGGGSGEGESRDLIPSKLSPKICPPSVRRDMVMPPLRCSAVSRSAGGLAALGAKLNREGRRGTATRTRSLGLHYVTGQTQPHSRNCNNTGEQVPLTPHILPASPSFNEYNIGKDPFIPIKSELRFATLRAIPQIRPDVFLFSPARLTLPSLQDNIGTFINGSPDSEVMWRRGEGERACTAPACIV